MSKAVFVIGVLAAALLIGCGGSSSKKSAGIQASMKNIQFVPATINAKVGEKITWTNDDNAEHNVTSQSGAAFQSPTFGKGGTFTYSPTAAATIKYTCTVHPNMHGTIVVTS